MFCATEGMPRELRYVPTYTHTSRRDAKKLKWAYGTILYDVLHMYLYVYMCHAPQTQRRREHLPMMYVPTYSTEA